MDPINRIENLISNLQDNNSHSPSGDPLASFEEAIDQLVAASNKAAKAAAQAAIKNAEAQEEFQRKIAFLSGQVHKAESALAALEGHIERAVRESGANLQLNSKRQEILYWKSRLHQAGLPDNGNAGL